MVWLAWFLVISCVLVVFLKVVSFLISESVALSREELSSYECGFEHHNLSRVPFSFRYFLLTLIFLLFDLEVVILLGVVYLFSSNALSFFLLVVVSFILILVFGWLYEYYLGSLDWLSA